MKTAILIVVSVMVGCLCLQANAAVDRAMQMPGPDGKTVPCQILPDGLKAMCVKYTCDDATQQVSVLGCAGFTIACKEGEVLDPGSEDLMKTYPDCCPKPICRAA